MRTVLSGLLFALLSACVTAQGPDSGPDLGKGDDKGGGDAANALTILPIIVDQATRDWAASEPSAIDGEPFHEGRRFREGFARLLGALDDQGAPAAMLAVMFPEDAGEATALLTKTLDAYGAPVVLSDGEGRDPGLYRDRLVGHDMSRVRLIAEPEGEGVRVTAKGFGVPVDREGVLAVSSMAYAAHLERIGHDADDARAAARAAADCAAETLPGSFEINGPEAVPSDFFDAVVIEERPTMAPVSRCIGIINSISSGKSRAS